MKTRMKSTTVNRVAALLLAVVLLAAGGTTHTAAQGSRTLSKVFNDAGGASGGAARASRAGSSTGRASSGTARASSSAPPARASARSGESAASVVVAAPRMRRGRFFDKSYRMNVPPPNSHVVTRPTGKGSITLRESRARAASQVDVLKRQSAGDKTPLARRQRGSAIRHAEENVGAARARGDRAQADESRRNLLRLLRLRQEKLAARKGLTTPTKYFGGKTKREVQTVMERKFGRGHSHNNATTYHNRRTLRSFNVHQGPGHRNGRPHVDIRRRGRNRVGRYRERKHDLKDDERNR